MAVETVTETKLVDDFDGSEAVVTRQFGIDAKFYEIELSEENNAKLEEALAPFIEVARKLKRDQVKMRAANGSGVSHSNEHTKAVREWAQENGIEVSERGRISAKVYEEYEKAHA